MATRKFYDGFETYSPGALPTTNWDQDGSHDMPQVVESATDTLLGPRGGTKMVRINHTSTNTYETMVKPLASMFTNEGFIRFYWRVDTNFERNDDNPTTGAGLHAFRFFNSSPAVDWLVGNPSLNTMIITLQIDATSTLESSFSGSFSVFHDSSQWHKWERYWNYSTGVAKEWWDGTLVFDKTAINFGTTPFNNFYVWSNWSTQSPPDDTNHIYIDDFEFFSDATDGTACTGSMSDASIQASADPGNFPQVTLLDEFSGTAGTALPTYDSTNWGAVTGFSNLQINSAGDGAISASGTGSNYWKTANFGPNLDVTLKVKVKPASTNYLGVIVRGSGLDSSTTLSGYFLIAYVQAGTDLIAVYPITNGSLGTLITSVSQEFSIGDEIGMRIDGSTFKLYYKASAGSWERVGTDATNTTYPNAGQVSLLVDAALGEFDNVQIKTTTTGGQRGIRPMRGFSLLR